MGHWRARYSRAHCVDSTRRKCDGSVDVGLCRVLLESRSRVVCVTCTVQEALLFGLAPKVWTYRCGTRRGPKSGRNCLSRVSGVGNLIMSGGRGASLVAQTGKESAYNAGDPGLVPGLGRSPGEGNGNRLQYSYLENSMDRGAWRATVQGVAKSWTQLRD